MLVAWIGERTQRSFMAKKKAKKKVKKAPKKKASKKKKR